MLQHLSIKDFALVREIAIDFTGGMTVLTGETGAGKSIILDALSAALGGRADHQWIRPQAAQAEITAIFDISQVPGAVLWLADLALSNEDDLKACIIRRIIHPQGRSRALINGRPVTLAQLRLLGEYLVQIHGQHQHQSLLKAPEQLRLLDAFGQHETLLHQVQSTYNDWENLYQQQQNLRDKHHDGDAQATLLEYQITECETIQADVGQLAQLYQEHDQLTHAQSDLAAIDSILTRLSEEESGNVLQWLAQIKPLLEPIQQRDAALSNAQTCLQQAVIQLQEAHDDLQHTSQRIEIDPERLTDITHRLDKIHDIARKHKVEPAQLKAHYEALCTQREAYLNHDALLADIQKALEAAKAQYLQYATKLTAARQKAAKKLSKEVTESIRQLAMPGAHFAIRLLPHDDQHPKARGQEAACFEVSANPGHALQPLNKVASGGELSRMSLALELILAKYLATPCLVFDEVDVGISGKVGAIVGKALQTLGQSTQVLCITHLPQVAALGDQHFQVRKNQTKTQTLTEIQPLSGEARIEAIACMLSGSHLTEPAKAQAQQLMESS